MAKCFSHGHVFFTCGIWKDSFIKRHCFSKQEESFVSLNSICYNAPKIIGSGQGSGSRLPVVTMVTFFATLAFFSLGPSGSELLMEVVASLEMLIGLGII